MLILPEHRPKLADPPEERFRGAVEAPGAQPPADREPGEDVVVEGSPMAVETEGPHEATRRVIASRLIISYSILTAMGIAAVAFARSDAQAIALILAPYGTLVTGVTAYYFLKARG